MEQKARSETQAGNGIYDAAFNLDLKNPHNPDTGPGDVDHLLPEYEKLLAQIAATRAALKQELHHALTATVGTAK
jgi:type I restriction enzyme M protein